MIERVGRGMWRETNPDKNWENSDVGHADWDLNGNTFMRMARAAIRAMREPTMDMLKANIPVDEDNQRSIWIGMIDAALGMEEGK